MTEAILKGALAGLAYGLLLGPLFFISLQVTLHKGLRNGIALAGGAFFSDATLAAIGWWSSTRLMTLVEHKSFQSSVGLIGALLIIGFGLSAAWPKKEKAAGALMAGTARRRYSFMKGFALNTANPSNWLFWFGLAAAARADASPEIKNYTVVFLCATLVMVLTTDLAKVLLADKIGEHLRAGITVKIVRLAGIVLIGVGLWVLIKLITG